MKRCSASGMLTERSRATAVSRASLRPIPVCSRSASVICLPMVMTGLSELSGSWKTIAISAPSSSRISWSPIPTSSRPMNFTLPDRRTLILGSRFMIERARIVLPDPDSPTRPSVLAVEREADAVDRLDPAARRQEVGPQVVDLEQHPPAPVVPRSAGRRGSQRPLLPDSPDHNRHRCRIRPRLRPGIRARDTSRPSAGRSRPGESSCTKWLPRR